MFGIITLIAIILPLGIYMLQKCRHQIPKNYRQSKLHQLYRRGRNNRTQRFRPDRIPKKIDHIVIGCGISGLTCAAALAKNGKRVMVLEKHNVIGGSIHTFKYKDFGVEFDTGFNYTGEIEKTQYVLNILGNFPIEWKKLGGNKGIFDRFLIGNNDYFSVSGKDNMLKELKKRFPDETNDIDKYFEAVCSLTPELEYFFRIKAVQSGIIRNVIQTSYLKPIFKLAKTSTYTFVSNFIQNKDLINLLCALSIGAGPPPKKQSALIHVGIVSHFLEGAYYPIGGPSKIISSLIQTIELAGGKVFTNASVVDIRHREIKGICQVESVVIKYSKDLKKIHQYDTSSVISSIGIPNTFKGNPSKIKGKLPLITLKNHDFEKVLEKVPSSVTYSFLYIVIDESPDKLDIQDCNHWVLPNNDMDKTIDAFKKDPLKHKPIVFIASNSAKDPTWRKRYPNKTVITAICWSTIDMFSDIDDGESGERTDDKYRILKKKFRKILLEYIYKVYPKVKSHVRSSEEYFDELDGIKYFMASPSTVKHYLNSVNGECYGMDATIDRFDDRNLRPETSIKGLWLTGQDIVSLGFSGAMWSGVLTANCIEGYGTVFDILTKRDLLKDLQKMRT